MGLPVECFVDHNGKNFWNSQCGVTGEALSDQILSSLKKYGLDVSGQGYDGAGGRISGPSSGMVSSAVLCALLLSQTQPSCCKQCEVQCVSSARLLYSLRFLPKGKQHLKKE